MTADAMAACLQAAGYRPDAAASRAAWLDCAAVEFQRVTGALPEWRWCVPGRIEVFGKHTDYAGGQSLLAAVPRGFAVVARPRTDGCVRVIDARHGDVAVIDVDDRDRVWRGWANYAAVVVRRLAMNFPGASLGADIAIASDLPRAAGLSSSSALVVGVALALVRRAGLERHELWRQDIAGVEDLAWYLGCVENGLTYKSLAGSAGVGTHGGSQDHTAILACQAGCVSQYGFIPVRSLGTAVMAAQWRFVVASSGVHADKAGSVRVRYNRASLAVRALLELWNRFAPEPAASLGAALSCGEESEAQMRHAIARTPISDFSREDLERRLTQFVGETARVPLAAAAFASADRSALRALAEASQQGAEQGLNNQIPETVALCGLAYDEGAFGASAFGAGFGGSVWAMVPAGEADDFGAAWIERYREAFPHRDKAEWFSASPGPAAVEVA
ncbi:MAG: galactokinase [Acidobacteria bacterium]|nr:galactokinase [Acidobacteriota bacterium]